MPRASSDFITFNSGDGTNGDFYIKKDGSESWFVLESKGVKSNSEKWHNHCQTSKSNFNWIKKSIFNYTVMSLIMSWQIAGDNVSGECWLCLANLGVSFHERCLFDIQNSSWFKMECCKMFPHQNVFMIVLTFCTAKRILILLNEIWINWYRNYDDLNILCFLTSLNIF